MVHTPPYDAITHLVLYLFLDRPCHSCSYSSGIQVLFSEDQYERNLRAPMWSSFASLQQGHGLMLFQAIEI